MSMTQTPTAHIRLDEQGRAWIDGTKVKVIEVVLDKIGGGLSPEEIHAEYPHLSLAQIHAALSYYYDHQAEFDAQIAQENREIERLKAEAGESPFAKRMRASGQLQ